MTYYLLAINVISNFFQKGMQCYERNVYQIDLCSNVFKTKTARNSKMGIIDKHSRINLFNKYSCCA